jgi:hypothetical protein
MFMKFKMLMNIYVMSRAGPNIFWAKFGAFVFGAFVFGGQSGQSLGAVTVKKDDISCRINYGWQSRNWCRLC